MHFLFVRSFVRSFVNVDTLQDNILSNGNKTIVIVIAVRRVSSFTSPLQITKSNGSFVVVNVASISKYTGKLFMEDYVKRYLGAVGEDRRTRATG